MPIRDASGWPDDKVPRWVLESRLRKRQKAEQERQKAEQERQKAARDEDNEKLDVDYPEGLLGECDE